MTTRDIPTVEVQLSRAQRRPGRNAAAMAATTTASAPRASGQKRGHPFRPFRFSGTDVVLAAEDIEADLRYGRD